MESNSLYVSRFAHFVIGDNIIAAYHALRMMPVYFSPFMLEITKKFEGGTSPREVAEYARSTDEEKEVLNVIEVLKDAKILINNPQEDDKALDYFKGMMGNPYPHLAYFLLTDRCNFHCSYCFLKNQAPVGYIESHMSEETAIKGLDFFCRLIAEDPDQFSEEKTIIFYGGEPLMNWTVFELLLTKIENYIASGKLPEKTTLNLVTNGTLLTPNIANTLKKHNVQVSISIDGDEFATNSCRVYESGRPVYQDIRRGFEICKNAGMDIGASCTLSEACITDFDKTLKVLLEEYAFIERRVLPFDCGAAGGNQIVIAPNGDVGICHGYTMEKKYFPTHVDDHNFDITKDPDFLEWSMRSPLNMPECQGCIALGICGGGCPFQAEIATGSIWGLDERFCTHAKMTLEWLIWDIYAQMGT
jgi:uncharacterized protein